MRDRYLVQGGVYYCSDIADTIGVEQRWNRPCIILSTKMLNANRDSVLVVPITSRDKKLMLTHYELTKTKYPFLAYESNIVLLENISDMSKWRLGRKFGKLSKEDLDNISEQTKYLFKDFYIGD